MGRKMGRVCDFVEVFEKKLLVLLEGNGDWSSISSGSVVKRVFVWGGESELFVGVLV
jgi:hypothetical protein